MDWKLNVFPTLKNELCTFFDARWISHNNITYVLFLNIRKHIYLFMYTKFIEVFKTLQY